MNSFDNCRVAIVPDLVGGIGDTLGDSKGSESSLLEFLATCEVLFVIFIEYLLSYLEMVSQLEAIAVSVWSGCLFSASFKGWWINLFEVPFPF